MPRRGFSGGGSNVKATYVAVDSTRAIYNWASKNSAFNYYDASGYDFEIIRVHSAVQVDSDAVANADATIVLTDGSASWSASGIDDSAYQDGLHIIHVTDEAGKVAFGYYKSGGSGAVVNVKSGATQNWISVASGFSTAGNFTRKILFAGS